MAEKPKSKPIKLGGHTLNNEQLNMVRHCLNTTLDICEEKGKIHPEVTRELMFIVLAGVVDTGLLYATLDVQLRVREEAKSTHKKTVH